MAWATMAGLVVLAPNLADVADKNELTYRPIEELIDRGMESGAAIDLIAPMRPAVRNPQSQVEAEE